jgi:hypothetical protein
VNPGNNFEVGILRSLFLTGLGLFASLFSVYLHVVVSQMHAAESVTEIVAIGFFLTEKTLETLQKVSEPRESLVQEICGDVRFFIAQYRELDKVADTPCNLLIFTPEFVPFIERYLGCGGFLKSVLTNDFLIEILVHFGSYSENLPNWMRLFVFAELILPDLFVNEEIVAFLIRMLNVGPLKTLTLLQSIHRGRADLLLFEESGQKIANATLDILLYSPRNCFDLTRQMLRIFPPQFVHPSIEDRTASTF